MDEQLAKKLPLYQSHKKVRASKIITIQPENNNHKLGAAHLILEQEGFPPQFMDAIWIQRFRPEVGMYLVVYSDGYTSVSPAQAFEEGNTLIKE